MTHARALQGNRLALTVRSGERFDVRRFSVSEQMSSLFNVRITALSENPAIDLDAVVGVQARFTMTNGVCERFWSGICNELHQIGVEDEGLSTYEITIVPELWLTTQRRNYRIFQQISEPDIVLKLLSEWGIQNELRLADRYKKRKYRVQYAESDYNFMSRILADAGISFYFAQVEDETKLVLTDAPHRNDPRAERIPFRDDATMMTGWYVTNVCVGQRVRPGRYTMRDHDFRRAPVNQPLASVESARLDVERRLERYHYTPGAFLFGTDKGEGTPVADDRGRTRVDDAEAALRAQRRLEAKRTGARVCMFETNVVDLAPGVVMSMSDHPRADLTDKALLIVEATHAGTSSGEWSHSCGARSAEQPYRPPLGAPKPKTLGLESATVVGPRGEEIHTDEFGRVRVHFHWDRESRMDETSSCWIHVSQPWCGTGYGGTSLPRVGQEVLVDFLGGDPDRPVIVGRVYTSLQKTPYKLPDNKTRSGWKSNSTGGGGGYNEIMFEDAQGRELVNIQAQKDLRKLVKNNEAVRIGNNRTTSVAGNDSLTVGGNRTHRVQLNEQISVGMSQTVSVGINRVAHVGLIDSTTVGEKHVVTITPPGEGSLGGENTTIAMQNEHVVLDTGAGASITMQGSKIKIVADTICLWAKNAVNITSEGNTTVGGIAQLTLGSTSGDVVISGGPMVKINT
ncbi:type VI secretion system tip protein TssI/VgrG [Sorangium sp. So ce302]|uniref:type VI secretion system Vgr family protein n=1 Tax=Sorangium sp. So ce302 TaxID=3133297 RepID=UPI003F61303D